MARGRTHPGEVLRGEFMKPLGLSANALGLALRVPATRIGDILRTEKPRAATADAAIRLARYFGTTAHKNGVDTRNKSAHDGLRTVGGPVVERGGQN
jgi:addiction module HigA family antidote